MLTDKQLRGQYFTTTNPFVGEAFDLWNSLRPKNVPVIEPFAGAGNLFDYLPNEQWEGYDLEPQLESIKQRDTLKDFPGHYEVAITNPPYLAKNSVKRRGGDIFFKYEDLYLDCLEVMLEHCDFVAAIIPSTFIGTGKFQHRLMAWDKLDYNLFSDTDCPAGVAYFIPERANTKFYVNGKKITPHTLTKGETKVRFNVADGNYVLTAIDTTKAERISIAPVDDSFDRDKYLKNTSRNYVLFHADRELDCDAVNAAITEWRAQTNDFYLTSFKSLMKSGKYRKRLSFKDLAYFLP